MAVSLVVVNAYRMAAARVFAGLTVRQVAVHFDLDVRPGEYFGRMPVDDLERARDLYGVRPQWLEEEGPINDPRTIFATLDMVGTDSTDVVVCCANEGCS